MSNYILLPNGDTVHEDELYHWKYVKREKQANGKWRYYYDTDELKSDVKAFVNDPTGAKRKKAFEDSIANLKNTRRNIDEAMNASYKDQDRARFASENYGGKSEYAKKMRDKWIDNAEKTIEKFAGDDRALEEYTRARDAYEKTLRGKLDKAADYATDEINRITGNDYRKAMNAAERELRWATEKHAKSEEALKRAEAMYEKNERSENPDVWRNTLDRDLHRATIHELDAWLDEDNAAEKYVATRSAYMKTPLGKLEAASDKVENWLDDVFNKKRRRSK